MSEENDEAYASSGSWSCEHYEGDALASFAGPDDDDDDDEVDERGSVNSSESGDEELEHVASALRHACEMAKTALTSGCVEDVDEDPEAGTPGLRFTFEAGGAGTSRGELACVAAVVDGEVIRLQYFVDEVDGRGRKTRAHFILDSVERTEADELKVKYAPAKTNAHGRAPERREDATALSPERMRSTPEVCSERVVAARDEAKGGLTLERIRETLRECARAPPHEGAAGRYLRVKKDELASVQKLMVGVVNKAYEERVRSVQQQAEQLRRLAAGGWGPASEQASEEEPRAAKEIGAPEHVDTLD